MRYIPPRRQIKCDPQFFLDSPSLSLLKYAKKIKFILENDLVRIFASSLIADPRAPIADSIWRDLWGLEGLKELIPSWYLSFSHKYDLYPFV